MTTYVIGETQGCYKELLLLLEKINYNEKNDQILFTGNYINNKNSIKLINYIKKMEKNTISILGEQEIKLLSSIHKNNNNILKNHKQKIEILNWIQHLPLIYFNKNHNSIIVHAGLYPFWEIEKTIQYTKQIENILKTSEYKIILKNIYLNNLNIWNNKYDPIQKYQFIINTLTKMTICNNKGYINTKYKNTIDKIPNKFKPWFMINEHLFEKTNIIFGNWKELLGLTKKKNIISTNTGATWGLYLSAINLNTKKRYYIKKI
ncbi:MAG TPA: symmetrical bis(5'-nucleosyl)-tetraphosphatase [Candidatus Azosocius sp. HAIN]